MLVRVTHAVQLPIAEALLGVGADPLEFRNAVDRLDGQAEAVDSVLDRELQGSVDVAPLPVAADVEAAVFRAAVDEAVNQPGVPVEVEEDGLVDRKSGVEIVVGEPV